MIKINDKSERMNQLNLKYFLYFKTQKSLKKSKEQDLKKNMNLI